MFVCTWIVSSGFSDEFDRLWLCLSLDDDWLLNIFSHFDNVTCSFSFLLSDLLGFGSFLIFLREGELSDGNILNVNVEKFSSFFKSFLDFLWDFISLTHELACGILSYNCAHNFVDDRWQNLIIVVNTNVSVEFR